MPCGGQRESRIGEHAGPLAEHLVAVILDEARTIIDRANAAAKLGMVRARMGGILNSMSDGDRSATEQWFDALPAAQAMAVVRALAGR